MFDIAYDLELELKKQVYTDSYFEFFKFAFGLLFPNEKYEDAFHIEYLCNRLQAEVERVIRREEKNKDIIINIPPRSSKSLITSVCLLPWVWIKMPSAPFICVSFDEDLSYLNAQYSRDIIKSDEYQALFGSLFKIRNDADGKGFFQNNKGGFRLSKTTGANITGHKGLFILVDDPQNPKTAESEVKRKDAITYYTNSLYNRLTPINLGVRIIIMQRLHEEDLTGYLLKTDPESYEHICLPAELSEDLTKDNVKPIMLRSKYIDGLLDPIRLGSKILRSFKKVLGSRGYSGQYDQKPSPDEGGIIKKQWFDIVLPESLSRDIVNEPIHFFIDSAYTEKTENDPTAILTCFKQGNFLYVVDVQQVWLEFPELIKFIKQYVATYQLSADSKIFIEPKASGKSIASQLRAETALNIVETAPPDTDKVTRAHAGTPKMESRRVRLVAGGYIHDYLNQLAAFPNDIHDDMVDVTVNAIDVLLPANDNPDVLWL